MLKGTSSIPGKSDLLLQNPHSEIQHMFYNLLSILVTGVDNAIWCGYHISIRVLVIMPIAIRRVFLLQFYDDNAQDYR